MDFLKSSLSASPLSWDGVYFALQHIEVKEYICLLSEGIDHLVVFNEEGQIREFRAALGLDDHVDVVQVTPCMVPFMHYWYNGGMIVLSEPLS